ncbi:MAG: hypothetical protein LBJ16_01740 [Holosporaceae bacterium]|jgi:hypothetical protein|nr:hypothetical protein [Holosporaceae bacterium]
MKKADFKFIIVLLVDVGCSSCKTPPLPDLDAPSFSHEEIMNSMEKLKMKRDSIRRENAASTSAASAASATSAA